MSSPKSPHGVQTKPFVYQDFQGLDTTRDITALDTGSKQYLANLVDGFCDWRGQITRDPGATHYAGRFTTNHIEFYAKDGIVWAEQDGKGVNLVSDIGVVEDTAFTIDSTVTSTVFNRKAHFFSSSQQSFYYDGSKFSLNQSVALDSLRPAFATAVGRRLAVAGISGRETEVHLSRVDDHEVFPDDEAQDSTNVLRAAKIDIANYTGAAEPITAVARFEQSRLVIFTTDRAVVFAVDPDVSTWTIDERANINVGCVSHNTVCLAEDVLMFCSRSGVHTLGRSRDNGLTIGAQGLSDKIDILYRKLMNSVPAYEKISAAYDQDMGQYHVFFPQPGGTQTKRLTLTFKNGVMEPKWSVSEFMNARCGASQGGRLFMGTPGGVYEINKIEDAGADLYPNLVATLPYLWHGSFTDQKSSHSVIIQASGNGNCTLEAFNEEGVLLDSMVFEIDASPDDNNFPDVPLSRQYERRFEHRYKAVAFRLTVPGSGLLRIIGLAVVVRKE